MTKRFLIISLIVLTSAFAWAQDPKAVTSEPTSHIQLPATPQKGYAMVYVLRPASTDLFSSVYIYLNDRSGKSRIGYIKGVEYLYFQVQPGKHKIFSQGRNWKNINIDVEEGEILFLEQPMKLDIDNTNVDNMIKMDPEIGRYLVTHIRMGTLDQR